MICFDANITQEFTTKIRLYKRMNELSWTVLVILFTLWFLFIGINNKSEDAELWKIRYLREELNIFVLTEDVYSV